MAAGSSGAGCGKAIAVGCVVVGFLGATLVAGAWLNRDAIRQMPLVRRLVSRVEEAKSEAKLLLALRASLQVRYPSDQVKLLMQVHAGTAGRLHRLSVVFVNPKFALPEDPEGQERQAREIAREVARVYPEIGRYDQIRISFFTILGKDTLFPHSTDFDFPLAALRAAPRP